jgi:hypothetical protein
VYALSINPADNVQAGNVPMTVHVFTSNAGALVETRTFRYTTAGMCCALAADSTGTVYVSDFGAADGQNNLYVFAPTASGDVTPIRSFPLETQNSFNLMTTDPEGNLYAKQVNLSRIYKYSAGFTSSIPDAILDPPPGAGWVYDMSVDASGHIFLLDYLSLGGGAYGVTELAGIADNSVTRYIELAQPPEQVSYPGYLATDSAGFVYVGNFSRSPTTTSVYEAFGLTASETAQPNWSFASSVFYCFQGYGGIAVQ